MFLLTANFVKNRHIYTRIFFIFLESVLNQTENAFNTKYLGQRKDQKSSYQVREAFAISFNMIGLTLS